SSVACTFPLLQPLQPLRHHREPLLVHRHLRRPPRETRSFQSTVPEEDFPLGADHERTLMGWKTAMGRPTARPGFSGKRTLCRILPASAVSSIELLTISRVTLASAGPLRALTDPFCSMCKQSCLDRKQSTSA